jgi:hypothetical protein
VRVVKKIFNVSVKLTNEFQSVTFTEGAEIEYDEYEWGAEAELDFEEKKRVVAKRPPPSRKVQIISSDSESEEERPPPRKKKVVRRKPEVKKKKVLCFIRFGGSGLDPFDGFRD